MTDHTSPLVSIILVTRRTPALLLYRCIHNIQNQTYLNQEIILINANDKDSSYTKGLKEDLDQFPDIIYLEEPDTGHLAHAKNLGIQNSHGTCLAFPSPENVWHTERLNYIVRFFSSDSAPDVVYTPLVDSNGVPVRTEVSGFPDLSQAVFQRNCFESVGGFDEKMVDHSDEELWFRIRLFLNIDFLAAPETTVSTRLSLKRTNLQTMKTAAVGCRQFLVKYRKYFKRHKQEKRTLYLKIAWYYRQAHQYLRFLQFFIKGCGFIRLYSVPDKINHRKGKEETL